MALLFQRNGSELSYEADPVLLLGESAKISFTGEGRARFRVQHTGDDHGRPQELAWCDISALSLLPPGTELIDGQIVPLMTDWVDGAVEFFYYRYAAQWIRVVPFDEEEDTLRACTGYRVSIEMAQGVAEVVDA